jgi:hypothetical protein
MEIAIAILTALIPGIAGLIVSNKVLAPVKKLSNSLVSIFSILTFLLLYLAAVAIQTRMGTRLENMSLLSLAVGLIITGVCGGLFLIKVREKRCAQCRNMTGEQAGEPELMDKVFDTEVVKDSKGNERERLITLFYYETPHACTNCKTEWRISSKVKKQGHIQ